MIGTGPRKPRSLAGWTLVATAACALTGCASNTTFTTTSTATPTAIATSTPTPTATPAFTDVDRAGAVYAALLGTFVAADGEYPPPAVISVETTAKAGGGWTGNRSLNEPIPRAVQEAVAARLDGVVDVRWTDRLEVPKQPDGRWYVTVSPVPDSGDRLEISVSASAGFDRGWLNTYVLEPGDAGWRVTGTTAPVGLT